jgi:hypothetical protein
MCGIYLYNFMHHKQIDKPISVHIKYKVNWIMFMDAIFVTAK